VEGSGGPASLAPTPLAGSAAGAGAGVLPQAPELLLQLLGLPEYLGVAHVIAAEFGSIILIFSVIIGILGEVFTYIDNLR
jgi:hypothetical protein